MLTAQRKYTPVWEQIKTLGWCEVSAHRAHHKRIRKALRKEKDMDLLYKYQCLSMTPPMFAIVTGKVTGSVIRFTKTMHLLITLDSI